MKSRITVTVSADVLASMSEDDLYHHVEDLTGQNLASALTPRLEAIKWAKTHGSMDFVSDFVFLCKSEWEEVELLTQQLYRKHPEVVPQLSAIMTLITKE